MKPNQDNIMYFLSGLVIGMLIFIAVFSSYQTSKKEISELLDNKMNVIVKDQTGKEINISMADFLKKLYSNQIEILNK